MGLTWCVYFFFWGGGYHVLRCSIFLGATISYHSATLRFHAVPRMARHCYCFSHGGLGLVEMPQLHVLLVRGGLDVCSQGLGGNQWQPRWVFRATWNQNVVIDHLLKNMMFTQFHVGSTGPMRSARNMWGNISGIAQVINMNLYLFGYQGKLGDTARCYCIMTVYQDGYGEMNHQQTCCKTVGHQVDTWHVQRI